ncbi:hypothetical protein [Francisella sp. 19X1-34]|uniref:hypothetical protein n=1 Tax=Francisella sp. 19X1-34 TaxID=3087177 RepID=UPI002E333CF9|nr:hypothetical protein [Francisella sp. 19X1-34]MED7788495.1 hypothetical protein [Francisella sp. 19X1-34]
MELRREADQTTEQLIQYVDAVETYLSLSTSRPTYQNGVKWLKVRKLLPKNYELTSFFLKKDSIEAYVTRLSRDSLVANIKIGPLKYKDKSNAIADRVSQLLNNHFLADKQLSGVSSILAKQNFIKIKIVFQQLKDPWLRVDGGNSMKGDLTFSGQQSTISNMTDLDFVGGGMAAITSVNTNSKSQQEITMYGEPTFNISSNNIYFNTNKNIEIDVSQANIGADAEKVYFSSNNKIKLGDVRFDVFDKQSENQRTYLSDFLSLFDAQKIQKVSLTRDKPSTTISSTCKKNQESSLFVYVTNYSQNTHNYGWSDLRIDLPIVSDDNYVGKGIQVDKVGKGFKVEMLKNKQGEYYYSDVELSAMLVCKYLIYGG